MISLTDIENARDRIAPHVRRTPVIAASGLQTPIPGVDDLWLKLELLQVTGSFKARGAMNKLLSLSAEQLSRGIVAASGGNHGIATARAGYLAKVPTTIFLPTNASPSKIEKLKAWGADVRIVGAAWHESNVEAIDFVEKTGAAYIHPFADPLVAAGQGTVALELLEQLPEVETVLIAMGGGGLISGMSTALRALKPGVRIVGIEAEGAPVLLRGIEAGHNVALEKVTTSVATMACARTEDSIFQIVADKVDEIVLVSDDEMRNAAEWLWFEMGLAADLSGAAAIAALQNGRIALRGGDKIAAIVCGAGPDALLG